MPRKKEEQVAGKDTWKAAPEPSESFNQRIAVWGRESKSIEEGGEAESSSALGLLSDLLGRQQQAVHQRSLPHRGMLPCLQA